MDRAADVVDQGVTFVDENGGETFVPFRDLVAEARRLAAALQRRGWRRGDRLGLIVPDHRPFIVTFLGALAAGLVPVPIYPPISLAKFENWIEDRKSVV